MLPQSALNPGSSRPAAAHRVGHKPPTGAGTPDFQAVILCGYGDSLYPLTEGENATPKALLPIGSDLLLDRVLSWVEDSGIIDVLVLCPSKQISAITNHCREAWPGLAHSHAHGQGVGVGGKGTNGSGSTGRKVGEKRSHGDHSRLQISIHGLDENAHLETSTGAPSTSNPSSFDADLPSNRTGTARILRRWSHLIHTDFVVLPCDISFPAELKLEGLLDKHRSEVGSLVTTLWYEKSELELKDQDAQESVLVGHDRRTGQLLLIRPLEELEDDVELRMSLLSQYPDLSLTTRLLDAHVYVFRRSVLDLIATREPQDLESIRENFLPWLVKGGWQDGLREKWADVFCGKPDPLAAALAKSTTSRASTTLADLPLESSTPDARQYSYTTSANPTVPSSPLRTSGEALLDFKDGLERDFDEDRRDRIDGGRKRKGRAEGLPPLKCNLVIWKTPKASATAASTGKGEKGKTHSAGADAKEGEPRLIRGNSIAGYWELSREFIRNMPPNPTSATARPNVPQGPSTSSADAAPPNIDPRSQISPDTLIAPTTKVGERTQIKKSIIGRHCVIGKNVRLTGCIVWDFVNIADGSKLENAILCSQVRVGAKAQIRDAEIGTGFEVAPDGIIKSERLAAGQDVA